MAVKNRLASTGATYYVRSTQQRNKYLSKLDLIIFLKGGAYALSYARSSQLKMLFVRFY